MDRFRKTFSMRKKRRPDTNESTKPQLWIEDEKKIKECSCSFQVKYLGCIEVFESRGMPVCEEAIKALRKSKKKPQRAILFVSGDALRVSDEISKHLIVDQTIEKVSFCAPDRDHEKGFAYICRDGATRRWMCHAFLSVKESGERLSHAVGCAFAICLEKKQKREREAVQTNISSDDSLFVRMSSFRQATLTERLMDPQSAIIVDQQLPTSPDTARATTSIENVSTSAIVPFANPSQASPASTRGGNPGAIPRPRPSPSIIGRQTSLRLFPKLQESSPFKQSLSMRVMNPPSTLHRIQQKMNEETIIEETTGDFEPSFNPSRASIPPSSPLDAPMASTNFSPVTSMINAGFGSAGNSVSSAVGGMDDEEFTKILSDPFSAAPFNPETIQQHHVAQQQQFLQNQQSRAEPINSHLNNVSPLKIPPADGFADWSLVLPQQPVASPKTGQQQVSTAHDSNVMSIDSQVSPTANTASYGMTLFGVTPAQDSIVKPSPFSDIQWNNHTNWALSPQAILPHEPNTFADPFDIGWADRATATISGHLAASMNPQNSASPAPSSNNPFLTPQIANGSM